MLSVSRAHHSAHMTGAPYWKWNQRMHTYIMLHQKMNAQETPFLVFLPDSKHVYDSKIKNSIVLAKEVAVDSFTWALGYIQSEKGYSFC